MTDEIPCDCDEMSNNQNGKRRRRWCWMQQSFLELYYRRVFFQCTVQRKYCNVTCVVMN